MATKASLKNASNKKQSAFGVSKVSSPARPFGIGGIVNIDNISDREYEMVQEILDNTIERKIYWKPQSFLSILKDLLSNKKVSINYNGSYRGMNIFISNDIKGRTTIKIAKGFTNKTILETFIPFKPETRMGQRTGTSRAYSLYNLFKTIRYQVDGELLAS